MPKITSIKVESIKATAQIELTSEEASHYQLLNPSASLRMAEGLTEAELNKRIGFTDYQEESDAAAYYHDQKADDSANTH